jgi:hypothetical protein
METNVAANVHASALVFASIESQKTGATVSIDDFLARSR